MLTTKQRDELIEIKGMAYGLSYMVDNPLGDAMLDIAEKIDTVLAEEDKELTNAMAETLEVKGL